MPGMTRRVIASIVYSIALAVYALPNAGWSEARAVVREMQPQATDAPSPSGRVEPASPAPDALQVRSAGGLPTQTDAPVVQNWPRLLLTRDAAIVLHQPQVDQWERDTFRARVAVEVSPTVGDTTIVGALWISGRIAADHDTLEATLYDLRVTGTSFPGEPRVAQRVRSLIVDRLRGRSITTHLGAFLSAITGHTEVRATPNDIALAAMELTTPSPEIIVRRAPAMLLQVAGEPLLREVADTGLSHVINASEPLFRDANGTWHLFALETWMTAPALTGPWAKSNAPPGVDRLPIQSFGAVRPDGRRAAPGRVRRGASTGSDAIEIVMTDHPAELVVIDGAPRFEDIGNLDLERLVNSDCEVFRVAGAMHYLLTGGRWYAAAMIDGPWERVSGDGLPEEFREIPHDAPIAGVRASVPGTLEAKVALVRNQVPELIALPRSTRDIDIPYDGEPRFEPAPGGGDLSYALNTPHIVLSTGGSYYCCFNGAWLIANDPRGPWSPASHLPAVITSMPPTSPFFPATYVRIVEVTPERVVFGSTGGARNCFAEDGALVYGTGRWYPEWSSWWWANPSTWGACAWYEPISGRFIRALACAGPYGLGPEYAWWSDVAGWQGWTDPGRPIAAWSSEVAMDGNDWLRSRPSSIGGSKVGSNGGSNDDEGVIVGRALFGKNTAHGAAGDVFVGQDGVLYRRVGGVWERRAAGGWTAIDPAMEQRVWNELLASAQARENAAEATSGWAEILQPGGDAIPPGMRGEIVPMPIFESWGVLWGSRIHFGTPGTVSGRRR